MITAERTHDFSYGHRIVGQGGQCEHIHGHNGHVTFVCEPEDGSLDDVGRVVDFSVIKSCLCRWIEDNWDHKFLVWDEDPWRESLAEIDKTVVWVPFNPTAENLAKYLVEVVGPKVLDGLNVTLIKCTFGETIKCSATYQLVIDNNKIDANTVKELIEKHARSAAHRGIF